MFMFIEFFYYSLTDSRSCVIFIQINSFSIIRLNICFAYVTNQCYILNENITSIPFQKSVVSLSVYETGSSY